MKLFGKMESAGWLFWAVSSLILVGPVTYGVFISLYNTLTTGQRIGAGVVTTLILAAILTTIVNEMLYRSACKRDAEEKLAEKKAKKHDKQGKKK